MSRRRRFDTESGAVAVLLAILIPAVLLPLALSAVSTYIQTGTGDESQRSADAGALAGARVIPLGDPAFMRSYLDGVFDAGDVPVPVLPPYSGPDPLDEACTRARLSLIEDSSLGDDYSDLSFDNIQCTAEYAADLSFPEDLGNCLENLAADLDPIPEVTPDPITIDVPGIDPNPTPTPTPLPTLPGGVVPTPTPSPLPTIDPDPVTINLPSIKAQEVASLLYNHLGDVLPALLKPGVRTTLTRTISGIELDGRVDDDDPAGRRIAPDLDQEREQVRVATARRRFKNLIVVPIVEADYTTTATVTGGVDVDGDLDIDIHAGSEVEVDISAGFDVNPALEQSWEEVEEAIVALDEAIDDIQEYLATDPGPIDPPPITVFEPGESDLFPDGLVIDPPPYDPGPVFEFDCQAEFEALLDDLNDIYSPGAGDPPSQAEVIADAEAKGEMVYAFVISQDPENPVTEYNMGNPADLFGIPFFDFVPVCISGDVAVPTDEEVGCSANATGGFRASLVPN